MITVPTNYDVIVIGVGAMGSATCSQLARRGKKVLGVEKYSIPHDHGSSHGYTRIIRKPYYENVAYVSLIMRAYELWRDLERSQSTTLLHTTGSLDAGPQNSWVVKGSLEACKQFNMNHEVLDAKEISKRFPGYSLPKSTVGIYQPDGGFLLPEKCISGFVFDALNHGAKIHGHESVIDWTATGDGVEVKTTRGDYNAEKLVITSGAWISNMVSPLDGLAVPERQVLAWLQPTKPSYFSPTLFPVFNLLVEEGRFYGFPIHDVPGFKFGKYHHLQESASADDIDSSVYKSDERLLRRFAGKYFPYGNGPTMSLKSCMFTNTPDNHFILDIHPDYPQVSFASACNGHGFKFASVIGEILADLAESGTSRHDISFFRLNRFKGSI